MPPNKRISAGLAGDFLAGVIEGFYGKPWSPSERLELFEWMDRWGLNTYLYGPKDDLKHRSCWRELYSVSEIEGLARTIQACTERKIRFVYALSPGLDIRYGEREEANRIKARFEQMLGQGCRDFALFFDDLAQAKGKRRGGRNWLGTAQAGLANELFRWLREKAGDGRFLFCPTAYCGRMVRARVGGQDYLPAVGRELHERIDVLWTGPEIVSKEIPVAHAREVAGILRRKPVIWDNLHANDYDGRRFYCGPYAGRSLELRREVNGSLSNPNSEFALNYVPLRTLGEFVACVGRWNDRRAYISAMREWRGHFRTRGEPIRFRDLVLLGDCYYLPYQEGAGAEALYRAAEQVLAGGARKNGAAAVNLRRQVARLRRVCAQMAELCDRELFYALSRRTWELREELDLLDAYLGFKDGTGRGSGVFRSDSHLPGTYRGGMLARLQSLLVQRRDGNFVPLGGGRG